MMDENEKRILQEHRETIARELVHAEMTQDFIYELKEEGILTPEVAEAFQHTETTKTTRMRHVITYLETRGEGAFQTFLQVLMQLGLGDLVMLLEERMYNEHRGSLSGESDELNDLQRLPNFHTGRPGQLPSLPRPPCRRPETPDYDMVESSIPDDQPLIINVIRYREVGGQDLPNALVYRNFSMPRGLVFMANFKDFADEQHASRKGSEIDVKNLALLFSQMGYKIPKQHVNMNKYETIKALREFRSLEALKYVDSCIVVIMSHGRDEKSFYTSDNHYLSVSDVVERFNNKECPALQGKPKIFIFQYCRGSAPDVGVPPVGQPVMYRRPVNVQTDASNEGEAIIDKHPTYTDMYIAYSTVEGFVSFRHPERGSWLMEAICYVFMKYSCDHELESLMKMVSRRVRDNYSEDGSKQVCEFVQKAFDRHFFFNPEPLNDTGSLNMSALSRALSDSTRDLEGATSPLRSPTYSRQIRHRHGFKGTTPEPHLNNNYYPSRHRNLSGASNASERSLEEFEPLNFNMETTIIHPRVRSLSGTRAQRRISLPDPISLQPSTHLPRSREAWGRAYSEQAQGSQGATLDPPEIFEHHITGNDVFLEVPQAELESPAEETYDVVDNSQLLSGSSGAALLEHISRESPLHMTGRETPTLVEVQRRVEHGGIMHSQSSTTISQEYEEEELKRSHMAIKRQNSTPSSIETLEKINDVRKFLRVHDSEETFRVPLQRIESFVNKKREGKRIKLDTDDLDSLEHC